MALGCRRHIKSKQDTADENSSLEKPGELAEILRTKARTGDGPEQALLQLRATGRTYSEGPMS